MGEPPAGVLIAGYWKKGGMSGRLRNGGFARSRRPEFDPDKRDNLSMEENMSIASTVAALERANAAYKAAQAAATPKAKRGMFALVERRCRASWLLGAYAVHVTFTPAIVTSVDRDGLAKEVRIAGRDLPLKKRDWWEITIDSAGRIADPEAVARRLVDERGFAIEYHDHAEAIAAIKAAAGVAP
jgi:hypothetical protein